MWNKTSKTITLGTAGLLMLSGAFIIPQITPASAQTPIPAPRKGGERHPEIRKAMRNLEQAKNNLQNAAHDFAGHREKAMDLTQQALAECKLALESDKK